MGTIKCIAVLAFLLCGCASALGEDVAALDIPREWKPSHSQNGKTISAVVRIIGVVQEPFPDPRTGKQVFQSKAVVLQTELKSKQYVPSSVRVYLFCAAPLHKNTDVRVTGELSISDGQIKGGTHPATIRMSKTNSDLAFAQEHRTTTSQAISTTFDAQASSVKPVTSAEEDDLSLPFVTFGKSIAPADPATDKDKPPRPEDVPSATAWEMVILPDSQTLVTRDSYTQVVHRDLKTGRMTRSMKSPDRLNFAILEICPQTGGFLSTDAETLSRPLLKDSQLMADLKKHFSYVNNTCFSADGKRVAVLFSAYHARVYDRGSGKLLRQFGAPPTLDYSRPGCITLSADGKHVAFKYGATKEAWNVETGVRLPMPSWGPDHLNWRDEYQFAPDGTLSIKQKHEISFWDVERGKQLRTLKDKPHEVGAVAFSADGKLMAHARKSSKGEVVLWDLKTDRVIRVLRGAQGGAKTICFTPDSKKLYASTGSTLTVGWDLLNADLRKE